MSKIDLIRSEFLEAQRTLNTFVSDEGALKSVADASVVMVESLKNGGKIISCGNGGSMCDAMHFAEEMSGRFREERPALAAIAISDPSHISCVGNDYGYEWVFSRYIEAIGRKGDVLLAISTSGNSKNILAAIASAKKKGMSVVGLTGKNGGLMAPLCDVEIRSPDSRHADRAQEIHIKVIHALIHCIEDAMK